METATQQVREGDFSLHARSAPMEYSPAVEPAESPPEPPSNDEAPGSSAGTEEKSGGWILRPLVWVVSSLLGLYLISQFASVISDTLALPPSIRRPVLLLEAAILLFLALLAIRCVLLYRSVPSFEIIPRENLRTEPAREKLVDLLDRIGDSDEWSVRCHFSPSSNMADRLRHLTNQTFADEDAWWDAYEAFEKMREERARSIVARYSKLIAIKTAASPWRVVDLAAVLYNSTRMIQDVVMLYHRRGLSRARSFNLVCHFAFNIYVSGEIGEVASKIGSSAGEKVGEAAAEKLPALLGGDELPESVSSMFNIGSGVVGKLAGKVAEGAVNALFAWRLGLRAIRSFRPTEAPKAK